MSVVGLRVQDSRFGIYCLGSRLVRIHVDTKILQAHVP